MKLSEFHRAVAAEFGEAYGRVLVLDTVLPEFGLTAAEALERGAPVAGVWVALCRAEDVPESRRHGVGLIEPPR